MVQESLVEYIRKLLDLGYDESTIRNTLLNAGYAPSEVAVAFRAARPGRVINTKLLLTIFGAVAAVVLIVIGVLFVMQPKEVEVSMNLKPLTTTVRSGTDFFVNVEIASSASVNTKLQYKVLGTQGQVLADSAEVTVRDRVALPVTMKIPEGLSPGPYTFTAELTYGALRKTSSVRFTVVEHEVQFPLGTETLEDVSREEAVAAQQECPLGCDDANACTRDICVGGVCEHPTISPCCGNLVCEEGESASSCAVDCDVRERPDDVVERAASLAATSISQAVSSCDSLGQRFHMDRCFAKVAENGNDKELCARIVDEEQRNACYMGFAYKRDFTVCPLITNQYMQNSCTGLQSLTRITDSNSA